MCVHVLFVALSDVRIVALGLMIIYSPPQVLSAQKAHYSTNVRKIVNYLERLSVVQSSVVRTMHRNLDRNIKWFDGEEVSRRFSLWVLVSLYVCFSTVDITLRPYEINRITSPGDCGRA